jgi:exodeoxyribonuclease VII small subunit
MSTSTPIEEPNNPSFETSLAELQQIVAQLEAGSLGLEQSLCEFERGVKLLRTCYRFLEDAGQKIELLVGFNDQGVPVTEPFDAAATYDAKEQAVGRRRSSRKSSSKPAPEKPDADADAAALF